MLQLPSYPISKPPTLKTLPQRPKMQHHGPLLRSLGHSVKGKSNQHPFALWLPETNPVAGKLVINRMGIAEEDLGQIGVEFFISVLSFAGFKRRCPLLAIHRCACLGEKCDDQLRIQRTKLPGWHSLRACAGERSGLACASGFICVVVRMWRASGSLSLRNTSQVDRHKQFWPTFWYSIQHLIYKSCYILLLYMNQPPSS